MKSKIILKVPDNSIILRTPPPRQMLKSYYLNNIPTIRLGNKLKVPIISGPLPLAPFFKT